MEDTRSVIDDKNLQALWERVFEKVKTITGPVDLTDGNLLSQIKKKLDASVAGKQWDGEKQYIKDMYCYDSGKIWKAKVNNKNVKPVEGETWTEKDLTDEIYEIVGEISELNSNLVSLSERQGVSNPNLLDNGWFNVNQRGQSEYEVNGQYIVDRWIHYNQILQVSDGIKISRKGSNNWFTNLMNINYSFPLTLSIKFGDNTIASHTFSEFGSFSSNNVMCSIFIPSEAWANLGVSIHLSDDEIHHIKAVKFELGSVSTLHLDTPPNPTEELYRCCNSTSDPYDTYANGYNPLISDAWNKGKTYSVNEYCIYNNSLYKCLVQNKNIAPSEGTYWTKTDVCNEIGNKVDKTSVNQIASWVPMQFGEFIRDIVIDSTTYNSVQITGILIKNNADGRGMLIGSVTSGKYLAGKGVLYNTWQDKWIVW